MNDVRLRLPHSPDLVVSRRTFPSILALLAANALPLCVGRAQLTVESSVVVSNAFVWRGLTTTNRAVIQPEVTLTIPAPAGSLTLGAWSSIEPARYDGSSDISAVYGLLPGPAFTQYSVWLEHGADLPGVTFAAGAMANLYPAVADLAKLYNTLELYTSATLNLPLAPSLSAFYDIGAIRGAYVEASISVVEVLRTPVDLSVVTGFNAGQGPDERAQSYFARQGLTHVELSATATRDIGRVTFAPTLHLIHGIDPLTRVTAPGAVRTFKLWFGAGLTWRSNMEQP